MTENKTYRFSFSDISLKRSEILDVLGYGKGEDIEYVSDIIDDLLKEAGSISEISAQYRMFRDVVFNKAEYSVAIDGINFGIEKIVFTQLKRSDSLAIFLCTAGHEIGRRSKSLMQERDFLKGYIYDIIGSEIVEAAADLMQDDMKNSIRGAGLAITNRYSPGYCGWNVADQHKLFQLMPSNHCGIELTESALMNPVKSVSGFIGIGEDVKWNPYSCRMCRQEDCVYRRYRENRVAQI